MSEGSLLAGLPALALFLAIRIFPIWPIRKGGCDAFFFLLCAEAFRQNRRVPVVLPDLFLLEPNEQWYPPGFMVFCGLLPRHVTERYYWLLNHGLDALIAAGLFLICATVTGSLWVAVAAIAAYGAAPRIAAEYASLTSRPLGALLFNLYLVAAYLWQGGDDWALVAAISAGTLLIFTHKLSLQLLWFLVPFLAVVTLDWRWLVPLLAAYAVAAVVGRALFVKIVRAHWDIVTFWWRNWRWLGAHPVKDSPVYGRLPERAGHYAKTGIRAWIRFAIEMAHMNYFAVFLLVAIASYDRLGDIGQFCFWWAIGTYLWAAATYYVPPLRALGQGEQYLKLTHAPVLMVAAIVLMLADSPWLWGLAAICGLLTALYYALTIRALLRGAPASAGQTSPELELILSDLRSCDNARILALPLHLSEMVAFTVRKPVLWGTHGMGFREVEPLFPVLRQPIGWFVERYGLTHILLDKNYVEPQMLGMTNSATAEPGGRYVLLELQPDHKPSAKPA